MLPIYFTVDEANALIPSVRIDLEALQSIKKQLDLKFDLLQQLHANVDNLHKQGNSDPFFETECEIEFLQFEAQSHISNIQRKGIELKDIEIGLVDFPAVWKGAEILLCWRLGEEQIMFYHHRDSGFMGRRPISEME